MFNQKIHKSLFALLSCLCPLLVNAMPELLYGPIPSHKVDFITGVACVADSASPANAGQSDLLFGYPSISVSSSGLIDVILGNDGATNFYSSSSSSTNTNFGVFVESYEDVNGDGFSDFVVCEPDLNIGYLYLSNGTTYSQLQIPTIPGLSTSARFCSSGASVFGSVGGFTGRTLVLGAPEHIPAGFSTNDGIVSFINPLTGTFYYNCSGTQGSDERFGTSIAAIADLNSDNFNDIIVGAPTYNGGDGRVYIISGGSGTACTKLSIINGPTNGAFGNSVSDISDVNGDPSADFLVGSPGTSQAFLFSGANGQPLCIINEIGIIAFGKTVKPIADANYDGINDFIVGSGADAGGAVARGYTYNRNTGQCDLLFTLQNPIPGVTDNTFGRTLYGNNGPLSCDLNGQGTGEFIITGSDAVGEGVAFVYTIPTATPTATNTPTVTVTSTVTTTPTSTATSTPRIVIPTNTPPGTSTRRPRGTATPTQITSLKSRLTYRLSPEGVLTGEIKLDKEPPKTCSMSLLAKYTSFDLSSPSSTRTILSNYRAKKAHRFSIGGLSKVKNQESCQQPYILHLISKHRCGSKTFSSNVYSRFLNCGKEPPVDIETFMNQLRRR